MFERCKCKNFFINYTKFQYEYDMIFVVIVLCAVILLAIILCLTVKSNNEENGNKTVTHVEKVDRHLSDEEIDKIISNLNINFEELCTLDVDFEVAARLVVKNQRVSASYISKSLTIGYVRASHIIEQLCCAGIVKEHYNRPYEVVLDSMEVLERLLSKIKTLAKKPNDDNKIYVSNNEVLSLGTVVPFEIWEEANSKKDGYMLVDKSEYKHWLSESNKNKSFEQNIHMTAQFNDEGKVVEANKDYDSAIKIYEANIALGGIATHSYERLMILYRKKKDYQNEIRIIDRYIKIFMKENERRARVAKKQYPDMADRIDEALELNTDVYDERIGMYIFCQYPILKYIDRRQKAQLLLAKRHEKSNTFN